MKLTACPELSVALIGTPWIICMWEIDVAGCRWMKGNCNIVGGWFGNCTAILWICPWLFFPLADGSESQESVVFLDSLSEEELFPPLASMKSDIKALCGGVFPLISVEVFLVLASSSSVGGEGYSNLKRFTSGSPFWITYDLLPAWKTPASGVTSLFTGLWISLHSASFLIGTGSLRDLRTALIWSLVKGRDKFCLALMTIVGFASVDFPSLVMPPDVPVA